MLQIDLQRWFRTGIWQVGETAPAESSCNYEYPKRMIHQILCFVDAVGSSEHADGRPFWHDDHLYLAEWKALQKIEYLFKRTLTVHAKQHRPGKTESA